MFAQVTNPPIDSLRETRVMTIKTRLGNLGNILDEDPTQCDMLQLESPVLSNAEFAAMRDYMGADVCTVDCTFPWPRARPGCAARWSASGVRRRRACAPAAPTSS
jgi:glutamate synthase (NADPH/NADH) large chain